MNPTNVENAVETVEKEVKEVETVKEEGQELREKEAETPAKPADKKFVKGIRKLQENPIIKKTPEHVLALACIIKDNAEIRRFTSLAILNYLRQKEEITAKKGYVNFLWDKFAVKANGLSREYHYTEEFFIKALISSFTSFANSASVTINNFLEKELDTTIDSIVTEESIANIVKEISDSEE